MLEQLLRLAAIVCSALVVLGFGLFAIDEARSASKSTAEEVAGKRASRSADPTPAQERDREQAHGDVRELIDDANDVLLSPFAGIVGDDADKWARRLIPALIALLVYGFGLGFLARLATGRM